MSENRPEFELKLARSDADLRLAQNLRYEVFVAELGGDGPLVDHANRREADRFDPVFDHLLLFDRARERAGSNPVVGAYRLLRDDRAAQAGQYYSEDEYDLGPLKASGRRLLELGRSCLHADYRGGTAMFHLWSGLADYVDTNGIGLLFGVASFHGTDPAALAGPLSLLHHRYLAPPTLRVRSRAYQPMNLMAEDQIDRLAAMKATPALIKGYLRLGGLVGDGAYLDRDFNTTDICLIIDADRVDPRQRSLYRRGA